MGARSGKQQSIEMSKHRRGAVGRQQDHLWSWDRRKAGSQGTIRPVEVENRTGEGRRMWQGSGYRGRPGTRSKSAKVEMERSKLRTWLL